MAVVYTLTGTSLRFAQTNSSIKLFLASMEQKKQSHTEDIYAFKYLDWLSVAGDFVLVPVDPIFSLQAISGPKLFSFRIVSAQHVIKINKPAVAQFFLGK